MVGRALTGAEVALLLNHAAPQHWPLFLTMVYTGMRLGEVLAMQWRYLTKGEGGIGLYAVEYNVDKRGQFNEVKTRSSRATIALSSVVVEALREQRATVAAAALQAGKAWTDLDLIFPRMGLCNIGATPTNNDRSAMPWRERPAAPGSATSDRTICGIPARVS